MTLPRWWLGALLAATLATHLPAWNAPEYDDDWRHRAAIDAVVRGDRSLHEFQLARHNEHFLPLWKTWYYATYQTWGREPLPWHVAISTAHFIGAAALVLTLRSMIGPSRALTAGFIWAGASFGNFDAPQVWIGSSHATFGVALWLLASAAATGFATRWWLIAALAVGVFWTAALASMLALLVLTAPLIAQTWWIEFQKRPDAMLRKTCFLAAILLPTAAGVVAQLVVPHDDTDRRKPGPRSAIVTLQGTGLLFAASSGNLVLPPSAVGPAQQDHAWQAAVATPIAATIGLIAMIGIGWLFWRSQRPGIHGGHRAIAWAIVAAVPWTLLACFHLSDESTTVLASHGRYRVSPTLFWSVAIATLPISLSVRTAIPLAALYLALQAGCAGAAAKQLGVMHRENYPAAVQAYGFVD